MSEKEEYSIALNNFYKAYWKLRKQYNLRLHTCFNADSKCIEIVEINKGKRICFVKEENATECYKRAFEEAENYRKYKT